MDYQYIGNCTHLDGELISKMTDDAEDIDYKDIREHIHQKELRILFPDYEWGVPKGLQLKDDWSVSFHKSIYNKLKCLYIRWSSIEFVWVQGG